MRVSREERLSQLQTVATRHIIVRGFDSVSVNELAEDLGMSVGGLYRYIQTKSDLLVMACENIYGGLRETLAEITTSSERDIPEKLRLMIEVYLRECLRNREQILLMYREYRHLPEDAHRRYKERELGITGLFSDVIGVGVRHGLFRDVHVQLLAQDIVLLGHLPALKGWAVKDVESDVFVGEHVALIMTRLEVETSAK